MLKRQPLGNPETLVEKGGEFRSEEAYLIVGLGNPGEVYRHTRHNIGFRVLESWLGAMAGQWLEGAFQSRYARAALESERFILLCPQTCMNLSGLAVRAAVDSLGTPIGKILVVHDDLDLDLGRVKVARNGGPGGHKGVRSVIASLGVKDFTRVKVGVGRPRYGERVEDFVLGPFYEDELATVDQVVRLAIRACEWFLLKGVEAAMNWTNCQNLAIKEEKS